jgi:fructokinase
MILTDKTYMDNSKKVIGIGEILWDMLPAGKQLGGAPTNFAYHAQQLGLRSAIISSVGNDELGHEIIQNIKDAGIINFIDIKEKSTGTVSVQLDKNGVPNYIIHEDVAWDFITPSEPALEFAGKADAVCFGSLAQRAETSFHSIQKILETVPDTALKVFDINMRQRFYSKDIILNSLKKANVLKINDEEILIFAEMFGLSGDEFEIMHQILNNYDLNILALTKGAEGSWLISREEDSYLDTPKVSVADTVGAGDSFTAGLVSGLLKNKPLKEIHRSAVDISAFVCTQKGATPTLPDQLKV